MILKHFETASYFVFLKIFSLEIEIGVFHDTNDQYTALTALPYSDMLCDALTALTAQTALRALTALTALSALTALTAHFENLN